MASPGATVAAALGQVWRSELDWKIRGIARKGGEAITGLPDSCDESPPMIPSSLASAPLVRQNYRVCSSRPEVTVSIIKLGFWCLSLMIAQPTLLLAKDRPAARTEADAKLPAAIAALSARIDALAQSQKAELKAAELETHRGGGELVGSD